MGVRRNGRGDRRRIGKGGWDCVEVRVLWAGNVALLFDVGGEDGAKAGELDAPCARRDVVRRDRGS